MNLADDSVGALNERTAAKKNRCSCHKSGSRGRLVIEGSLFGLIRNQGGNDMADIWAREWEVYNWRGVGGPYLGPGKFTLEAVSDPSIPAEVAFYRVTAMDKNMPACWKGIRLFPRGSADIPIPAKKLPVWNSNCDPDWDAFATALRKTLTLPGGYLPGINPEIRRLEGDLYPKGTAEALTLIRVEKAAEDGDVLVLILKSLKQVFTDQCGTAHGGNPH
jgi:hypothetical protein